MLEVTAAGWAATLGLVAALLAVDLFASGRRPHAVGFREAAGWSVFYIAIAALYGVAFGVVAGWDFGAQYFAGYVVEKSLSVDNLFVFVIIMSTFAVPAEHQHRALTFGILLALVMRALFIALGAALLSLFSFMFLIFGLLLIATAVQLFRHRDKDPSVEDNVLVAVARRRLPFTDRYDEGRLVTWRDGRRMLTPLSLVLVTIGSNRHPLRPRLDPGDLRRQPRGVHRVRGERLRAAGAACAVLPRIRPAGPPRVSVHRPGADPRVHRRQARTALRAFAGRQRSGDRHRHVARGDRRGPGDHDDCKCAQDPPKP